MWSAALPRKKKADEKQALSANEIPRSSISTLMHLWIAAVDLDRHRAVDNQIGLELKREGLDAKSPYPPVSRKALKAVPEPQLAFLFTQNA